MTTTVSACPDGIRPDPVRTLAMSTAIALNGTLLLLAIRPLPVWRTPRPAPRPAPVLTFEQAPPPPAPAPPPIPARPALRLHPAPIVHLAARVPPVPVPVMSPVALPPPHSQMPPVASPRSGPATGGPPTGTAGMHLAYLQAPPPRYPVAARRARMQGTVLLRVRVDAAGRPEQVRIARSSGYPLLDRAARWQVLRHWLFRPARVKGRSAPAWALVPVAFRLRED